MNLSPSLLIPALAAASLVFASCSSNTVGDQLAAQGEGPAGALGEEWKRADKLVKSGEKMVKKGKNLVDDGEDQIKRGKRLKAETELAATRAGYLKTEQ